MNWRNIGLFAAVAALFVITGQYQSWNLALSIFNMGLVSAGYSKLTRRIGSGCSASRMVISPTDTALLSAGPSPS